MRIKGIIFLLILTALPILAQDTNKVIIDEDSEKPMLIGYCTREAFSDSNFAWWFNSEYNLYDVDSTALDEMKDDMQDVDITIVMGTWCSDSRREIPHFYKILDYLQYPDEKVTLINVNRDKEGLKDETEGLEIELVPTIIFYRDGEEIGRITEIPQETLEKDLVKIISG